MDLFALTNLFHTGNFQQVVTDAASFNAKGDDALQLECDIVLHRATIALGNHFLVIPKIRDDAPPSLRGVKLLAQFMQDPGSGEAICNTIDELMVNPEANKDPTFLTMAATILNKLGKYEETLKYIHSSDSIELMAVLVQTYLYMDRLDLAEKQFQTMQHAADDATLTQLASTWVNQARGGEHIKQALFTYVDLSEKYGTSTLIFNGMAAAHMGQGEFEDAEGCLKSALQLNPKDPDTLANLVAVLQHLRPSVDRIQSTVALLQHEFPTHPFVISYNSAQESFNRIAGITA